MDKPALEWTLTASQSPLLGTLNRISEKLPGGSWRREPMLRARERVGTALGFGHLQLSGVMPSGHRGTLMPERMYFVNESRAVFEGLDLGQPARLKDNPGIGDVPLPARGMLAIGRGVWQVLDPAESGRTQAATTPTRLRA